MTTETVRLEAITPDPRNARRHDERNLAEIRRSLERFGQYRPFVVQRQGMIIRVGNGMYQVMRDLGWTEALAVVLDLTDCSPRFPSASRNSIACAALNAAPSSSACA